jgi:hypothetical protein
MLGTSMALNPFEQLQNTVVEPRQAFEEIVATMLRMIVPGSRRVRVHKGDGGVDVYSGNYGEDGEADVYQIKYFSSVWGDAQKRQIRDAYETARDNADYRLGKWTLCVPLRLTKGDLRWFDEWRAGQQGEIALLDGDDLTTMLQQPECAAARQQLELWGIQGLSGSGPRLVPTAFVKEQDKARAGITFVIGVQLRNEGDRTARGIRVKLAHSDTGCVAWAPDEATWLHESVGGLQPLNPWFLTSRRNLNPGEIILILAIPCTEQTALPFRISLQTWAEDYPHSEHHVTINATHVAAPMRVIPFGKDRSEAEGAATSQPPSGKTAAKPTDPAAIEILQTIMQASVAPEERGLTEILRGDPGDSLNAAFIPSTTGRGNVLTVRKRLFAPALAELQALGWLLPPINKERVRIYELNPEIESADALVT